MVVVIGGGEKKWDLWGGYLVVEKGGERDRRCKEIREDGENAVEKTTVLSITNREENGGNCEIDLENRNGECL